MRTSTSGMSRWLVILLTVVAAIWAVVRVGINTIPDLPHAAATAALWPQESLPAMSAYIRESPIGQVSYRIIGAAGAREYLMLHVAASVVALALWIAWIARNVPSGFRSRAARLALLAPLLALIISFFGSYDPFTILGFAAMLFAWTAHSRIGLVLAGCYMGFQHFEAAVFASIALMLTSAAVRRSLPAKFACWRSLYWGLLGVLFGKIFLLSVLWVSIGNAVTGRNEYWSAAWLRIGAVSATNFLPIMLYSLLAGLWAVVITVFIDSDRRAKALLALAFFVCFLPSVFALDHTRIFVITSAPAVALLIVSVVWKLHDQPKQQLVLLEVLAWVGVPVILWTGMDGHPYLQHGGWIDLFIMFGQQWTGYSMN